MSMPYRILECEKCGYTASEFSLWGRRSYRVDGLDVPMYVRFGWCARCEELLAIESFEDADTTLKEVEDARGDLHRYLGSPLAPLLGLLLPGRRKALGYAMERLHIGARRLHVIARRRGTERCLSCGSREVIPFEGNMDLPYDLMNRSFQGLRLTGFVHPGCGGIFFAKPSGVCINMVMPRRWYDFDGLLIEEKWPQ